MLTVEDRVAMVQQADPLIKQLKTILSKPDENQTKSKKDVVNKFLLKIIWLQKI